MNKCKRQLNRWTNGGYSKIEFITTEERDYKIERNRKHRPLVVLASSTWDVSTFWCISMPFKNLCLGEVQGLRRRCDGELLGCSTVPLLGLGGS